MPAGVAQGEMNYEKLRDLQGGMRSVTLLDARRLGLLYYES